MAEARGETTFEDERVRVTTWVFDSAGDNTGWHVHEYDYVIVPITGGTFQAAAEDGTVEELTQQAGSPYLGHEGTAHDVISVSPAGATFVEIELKR